MLQVALAGFDGAHERHSEVRLLAEPLASFVPLAEAVYWAGIVDEQLRRSWQAYDTVREHLPGGCALPGVRYARNLKTHQLPLTLTTVDGAAFPVVLPMVFREVVWLPADALPLPDKPSKHTPRQRASYEEHLAGRPVRHTLDSLREFFDALRREVGSPWRQAETPTAEAPSAPE